MAKKLKLKKHTLNLYDGDMDELRILFPRTEPSIVVRDIVHATITKAREELPKRTEPTVKVKL